MNMSVRSTNTSKATCHGRTETDLVMHQENSGTVSANIDMNMNIYNHKYRYKSIRYDTCISTNMNSHTQFGSSL